MKIMKKTLLVLLLFYGSFLSAQVGIGTAIPQKELHIAGPTSTIRIEKLNAINCPTFNKGGTSLTPVFVDKDGELTLSPPGHNGSNPAGTIAPLNFLINVGDFIPNNLDGSNIGRGVVVNNPTTATTANSFLISVPFSSPQSALIEVKYGVTVLMSQGDLNTPAYTVFTDKSARSFDVYFCIDLNNNGLDAAELSKRYGYKGQAYGTGGLGILGYPYMNSHGYANIPAGNHSLHFFAETLDGANKFTSVGFGGDIDYLKIRLFN